MAQAASWTPLLWFLGILALIPLVLWMVRRTPVGAAASTGTMRLVSNLPLSGTQRLVTVEVGQGEERLWLVLGVTGQQISALHTMAPQAGPVAGPGVGSPQTAFAQMLQRMRQGRPDGPAA